MSACHYNSWVITGKSDVIIHGSDELSAEIKKFVKDQKKPTLEYQPKEEFEKSYLDFFLNKIM